MFPTPAIAPLIEQERLHRRRPPARLRAQVLGGEQLVQRLQAEPRGEERLQRLLAEQQLAGAEAARVDDRQPPVPGPGRCARGYGAARGRDRTARRRSSAGAGRGGHHPPGSHTRYLPRLREPLAPAVPPAHRPVRSASSGRDQRQSRISTRFSRRPSTSGASWRLIVSTSGSSGTAPAYASRQASAGSLTLVRRHQLPGARRLARGCARK